MRAGRLHRRRALRCSLRDLLASKRAACLRIGTEQHASSGHPNLHWLCAGKEAAALEAALGIGVLRHREKKPAGGSEDMERHFGWVGG